MGLKSLVSQSSPGISFRIPSHSNPPRYPVLNLTAPLYLYFQIALLVSQISQRLLTNYRAFSKGRRVSISFRDFTLDNIHINRQ